MLLEKIKADRIVALKSGNKELSSFLNFIIAKAISIGKDALPPRETTDIEIISMLQKMVRDNIDTLKHIPVSNVSDKIKFTSENSIISLYLPTQVTSEELEVIVQGIIQSLPSPLTKKSIGVIMKELEAKYSGQYDKKLANNIIQRSLV